MLFNQSKLLLTIGCFGLLSMQPVLAQEQMLKTITVTGEGIERIPTTIANVQLGVEIQGENASQVQEEVAQKSNSLVNLLKSRSVQRLQTSGIQLSPNYSYNDNQRKLIGYVATNLVSFELPIDKVGAVLDESVKVGATRIDNVTLSAEEDAIASAQEKALVKATESAQKQANVILQTLNLTAQEIVTINVNGANSPNPVMMPKMRSAMDASVANTPVVGGEQTVSASVTLQIRY
ncbi:SIMPL domain-containing protein [Cyanobacterium aponinum]|uniref:DUF541 domain-containing protein n=1 Tax=Cyanobacterium aponinum 0216 TaxID=2676140 RepID=A0A844H0S7_9CHRO|nr:SIMPL domain-containing protein [Cyanobacterium aponinum]MTF40649.1 DUF541 domain-containing protein [Cyanobacterium aponinum 0216]